MHKCGVGSFSAGLLIAGSIGAMGAMIWPDPGLAETAVSVAAQYEVYAAGLDIAAVQIDYGLAAQTYQMHMSYHTTGVVSLFADGISNSSVGGTWRGDTALPRHLFAEGSWKGDPRLTDIDFSTNPPVVRRLLPSDTHERQPVPDALKAGAIDTLSAMADLMHTAANTGRCDLSLRTYDGHRVLRFDTRSAGQDMLTPYRIAQFAGNTLRCDFTATPVAGMKDDDRADARPLHGSIWLAPLTPGAAPIPVRMAFETRWFGDAIMGLIKSEPLPAVVIAGTH